MIESDEFREAVNDIIRRNLSIEIEKYTEYGEKGIEVRLVLYRDKQNKYETICKDRVCLEFWED